MYQSFWQNVIKTDYILFWSPAFSPIKSNLNKTINVHTSVNKPTKFAKNFHACSAEYIKKHYYIIIIIQILKYIQ